MAEKTFPDVPVGSRWHRWEKTVRNMSGGWSTEPFRVMAVCDNYAMCRFPRAVPFVLYLRDFEQADKYKRAEE